MEINEIPKAFQSKLRISIIASLYNEAISFTGLQKLLNATSGNLGKQLEYLEEAGYIEVQKEFLNKKLKSTYRITLKGQNTFVEYVSLLERIITSENAE